MAQQLSRSAHAFPLTRPPLEKLVLLSLAEPGASQPGSKMAGYADMTALNKSSGKVATFAVRVVGAKTSEYTFTSKRDTKPVTQHKFEAWLIGINAQAYCVGFVKGSQATVKQAQEKYVEGSVWALSKVVFDSYTAITFVSTPVPFRLDVAKSKMEPIEDNELCKQMPQEPVPPRSVADIARITSKRSTDLIAIVKDVGEQRTTKSGLVVADVTLIDNSESSAGVLATIKVGVFGETMSASKMILLRDHVGDPMVFFNLSVNFANGQLSVTHFPGDVVRLAPVCQKTKALGDQKDTLTLATNTSTLTAQWTPQQARDVSGPVPLSCAAFLDFTAESPDAKMPGVVQVMWVVLEEPEPDMNVRDPSGERVWFRTPLRDASGATTAGIPQKLALELANCESMQAFLDRHAAGELNLPLLCHVRITRTYKEVSGGASQPTRYVNHTVASVTPMHWSPIAAPNEAYRDVLSVLNLCPPHEEGLAFAFLEDICPDPYYGFSISYDGKPGPLCIYVAALLSSEQKSVTSTVGEGFKVTTTDVKDVAHPNAHGATQPVCHTLVGYCSLSNLAGFRLDPPRGKAARCALALFSKKDDEGLHIHKLEYVEPDQVTNAVHCIRKLRTLCKQVRPETQEKRSHAVAMADSWAATEAIKKARILHQVPTDASLGEGEDTRA